MIEIGITQGYITLVDDIDGDLADVKWWANRKKKSTYVARNVGGRLNKRMVQMHRLIMERKLGRDLQEGEHVDHIDGNPLNNVRDNLRVATVQQNNHNGAASSSNTSGFVGVSWSKQVGKWEAYISLDKKRQFLGHFSDPVVASQVRDHAARKMHGEYAFLNFPLRLNNQTNGVNMDYLKRIQQTLRGGKK